MYKILKHCAYNKFYKVFETRATDMPSVNMEKRQVESQVPGLYLYSLNINR